MIRAPVAMRFRARAPPFANLFLTRVAERLATAPNGSALLVERRTDDAAVTLSAVPTLAAALASCSEGIPGHLDHGTTASRRLDAKPLAFAFLVGEERSATEARSSPVAEPPVLPRAVPSAAPRAAVQSHWFPEGDGRLRVWTRIALSGDTVPDLAPALGTASTLRNLSGSPVRVVVRRPARWTRREWRNGSLRRLRVGPPLLLGPPAAAAVVAAGAEEHGDPAHVATVVLGASGSGKTSYLAALAARRIAAGDRVVAIDVHGDLAPAIVARLLPRDRERVVAIDASVPLERIVGIDVLGGGSVEAAARGQDDLVSALKRLSGEGSERRWGYRLERVLDAFVRLAREEEGTLVDVAALLTDERRREAARLATRSLELARFLEELATLLRRNPEYLQSAAARVSRVLFEPRLALLVAPPEGGIPVAERLRAGDSILLRLPFSVLGPEAAEYAASLLATRLYLELVRLGAAEGSTRRSWLIADEAHLLAPRLLVEAVTDGRKFGVIAVAASQYPERLAPELRSAAAGAAGAHLLFRTPAASARVAGSWVGLTAEESSALLPSLPPGVAVEARGGAPRRMLEVPPLPHEVGPWLASAERSSARWGAGGEVDALEPALEEALFALIAPRAFGKPAVERSARGDVPAPPPDEVLRHLARRGYTEFEGGRWAVTAAGRRYLGLDRATGAASESAEHRRLLFEAQRIFALRGERLEVVRQGRFDTRLPDGRLRLDAGDVATPSERLRRLEIRRLSWAWRCFGGRDVHVEAEVTGADRPQRIRRGLAKARARGAAVVFVVGDPRRARRVRELLRRAGATPTSAQVWTIPEWRGTATARS